MIRSPYLFAFMLIVASIFFSCENVRSPLEVQPGNQATSLHSVAVTSAIVTQSTVLGSFTVTYLGRTIDVPNNRTKFTYVVSGSRQELSFILEVPPCSTEPLLSYTPTKYVKLNADAVIVPSIQWKDPRQCDPTRTDTFSYTIGGIVKEATIQVGIRSGFSCKYGTITGPSKYYDISGSVFSDADNNGALNTNELGISNVTVSLYDASNVLVGAMISDAFGNYLFQNILCGNYTVQVDTATLTTQTQNNYLSATTPVSRAVAIGPDSPGNNFGFTPQTEKLIADIGTPTLPTDGASSYAWKKQFQAAMSRGRCKPITIPKDTLLAYLGRINALALPAPFQFALNDSVLKKAYDILNNCTKTDIANLLQQLLTTELNYERGLGLTDKSLLIVLIGWAESIAASTPGGQGTIQGTVNPVILAGTPIKTVVTILAEINSGGGGGLN